MLLPGLQGVLQAELQGIQPQGPGDALHVDLDGEEALGDAVAAEGAGGRGVGVDHIGVEADAGLALLIPGRIQGHGLVPGVARHRQGMAAVSSGVRKHNHLIGHDGPIPLHAGAQPDAHRVPGASGGELLLPGPLQPHRPPRGDGEVGGDVLDQHLLFASEAAADPRLDHPDPLRGEAEHRRQDPPHVEGNLGGSADHQAVVLIPVGDHHVGLQAGLLDLGDDVFPFEDVIGLLEPLVHLSDLDMDLGGQVAGGI